MNEASAQYGNLRPHPLAEELSRRLTGRCGARILELGTGSTRNRDFLAAAGFSVESFDSPPARNDVFDAALSTHALLHGRHEDVAAALRAIANALKPQAPLYATFASVSDSRYGKGTCIAPGAYAPTHGDEIGVPHAFFDEAALRDLLVNEFAIESLHERDVSAIVGRWAHTMPATGSVHYFLIAVRR